MVAAHIAPTTKSSREKATALLAAASILFVGFSLTGASTALAATAPNGLIAYSAWDASLNYDIYTIDPALPDVPPAKLTTDGRYNSAPDFSPDGTKIVYDGWSEFGGPRIQVMDTDPATADSTVISDPCVDGSSCYGDFQPAWSPDGTRIAFISARPQPDGSDSTGYEIYVMDATGEVAPLPAATRLTNDPAPDEGSGIHDSEVTWSPDGTQLAFLSTGRGLDADSCDLWVMDSHDRDGDGFGDNLHQITFDESFNCDAFEDVTPQWSPNSNLIAFTSARSGYFDIWLVNADDPTDLRNVTKTPDRYEDQPSWSPDGTQIIFRSDVSGAYEFYSLPVPPPGRAASAALNARPKPTRLTFDGQPKSQPDWGPQRGSTAGTAVLHVAKTGNGRVRTSPAGIACGKDCAQTFVTKTIVTLTAVPAPGYRFAGWSGACNSRPTGTCTLAMRKDRAATAHFARST